MGIAWSITVLVLNACYFDPEREMIQFDDHIFFNWVGSTTNYT